MNCLTCTLNIPLGPSTRDPALEADLQSRLDDGHRVIVVGDLHGHFATFRALLHRLKLKPDDRVVCLGDMIDRGPNSAELVAFVRSHPQLICIKGNHEQMAIQSIQADGSFQAWQPWMKRGGKSTFGSYIVAAQGDLWKARRAMLHDFMWLDTLPTQIVLDHIRLVHAGYDPRMPLDMQGEKELLWIRKAWHQHETPVDPHRTVFFGHTTTTKLGDAAGEVAHSPMQLSDGRPAWVGLDVGAYNHVSPCLAAVDVVTMHSTKQPTLKCDRWFERIDEGRGRQKKGAKVWRGRGNKKEAEVGDSFGLNTLKMRARTFRTSALRARRALEEVGITFPATDDSSMNQTTDSSDGNFSVVHRKAPEQRTPSGARGPTTFRFYAKKGTGTKHPLNGKASSSQRSINA